MSMTLDQAIATLQSIRSDKYGEAGCARRLGDEYKEGANAAVDHALQSHQFTEASRCYGMAHKLNAEAAAIDIVLEALTQLWGREAPCYNCGAGLTTAKGVTPKAEADE